LPLSIAKKSKVPVRIAHSHTSSFDRNHKRYIRLVAKKIIGNYATDFAGCSVDSIEFMFGKKIENYVVINNAIDVNKFSYNYKKRKEVRNRLGIKDATFVLGHVGRFDYPKNHSYLIDIFNEYYKNDKNSILILVGSGEEIIPAKEKVQNLNLYKNVLFLGPIEDVADIMQAMDALVMPSKYEGLPLVPIEAQANGLPCFLSDVITNKASLAEEGCYFLDINSKAEVWARQIKNAPKKRPKGVRSFIASSGYDISNEVKKLTKYYELKKI
jgi:glycosyltransferase EpsF